MNTTVIQTTIPNKFNKALLYLRFRISEMKMLIVINCLLGAAGFPVAASIFAKYTRLDFGSVESVFFNFGILVLIVPLVGVGMMFMAYACGISAFGHLHNKNICDMHISLPLTHRQRFWANFTAGLSITVIPYMVTFFVGLLIFQIFSDKSFGSNIFDGYDMNAVQSLIADYVTDSISQIITGYVIPIALIGLVAIVMTYSLTVFCNTLCGNFFTTAFTPLLISGVVPLLIQTVSRLAISRARGMYLTGNYPYTISTPIGYVLGSVSLIQKHKIMSVNMPVYIIPVLLITTGLIVSSFFLSKNIKAENIGRDFLYKSIYNVQQGAVCLCIVSFFGIFYSDSFLYSGSIFWLIFWAALVSFVAFAVGHIVHYKGVKQIKRGVIRYAAMLGTSILICVILVAGKGFGAENYIPAANNIQKVQFAEFSGGNYTINSDMLPIRAEGGGFPWVSVKDQRGLAIEARRVHKLLLENPETFSPDDETAYRLFGEDEFYHVLIDYELKNGSIVSRGYIYYNGDIDMLIEAGVIVESEQVDNNNLIEDSYGWLMDEDLEFFG
ncbi:MAG: hypothetical protein FWG33_02755 [Oscillospiraceae bacterium]|nr:hypothetical protein [Oscillospiraceae bacterium]